jgi:tripartite-type tricarboxylate transporter receptor subunit TctC
MHTPRQGKTPARLAIAPALFLLALCTLVAGNTHAAYPEKPVRLVVPFSAGSVSDGVARMLAKELSVELGEQFVVENKPGANSIIGAEFVARAKPDGYTLLLPSNTALAANLSLYKKLPYDPIKDFTPIARIGYYPFVLLVNPQLPAKNVGELLKHARANPGKLNYATSNSMSLVGAETINVLAKTTFKRVPYKANPQALTDLMNGQVHIMVADVGTGMTHVRAGKLRALAVTPAKRTRLLPDMPSIAEQGLAGYDMAGWVGIVGPAKLPPEVVNKLHAALVKVLARADVSARFNANGTEIALSTPQEFAAFIEEQVGTWAKLVKAAGIPAE